MGDWANMNGDILEEIVRRIELYDDLVRFGCVCSAWHSVASRKNSRFRSIQMPWLMLPQQQGTDVRNFYHNDLGDDDMCRLELKEISDHKCVSAGGWLVMNDRDLNMCLFEPVSHTRIQLPHMNTFEDYDYLVDEGFDMYRICLGKAVLCGNPSTSDYILMIIYGNIRRLAFFRPGFKSWILVSSPLAPLRDDVPRFSSFADDYHSFSDAVYHRDRDQFYTVGFAGRVLAVKVRNGSTTPVTEVVANLSTVSVYDPVDTPYLVELGRDLLVVLRKFDDPTESYYFTYSFIVLHLDISTGSFTKVNSLGDKALFVGLNSSVATEASSCKGNSIYFTDDNEIQKDDKLGKDTGIYNLEDGKIEPYYYKDSFHYITPPIWVEKNLYWNF